MYPIAQFHGRIFHQRTETALLIPLGRAHLDGFIADAGNYLQCTLKVFSKHLPDGIDLAANGEPERVCGKLRQSGGERGGRTDKLAAGNRFHWSSPYWNILPPNDDLAQIIPREEKFRRLVMFEQSLQRTVIEELRGHADAPRGERKRARILNAET